MGDITIPTIIVISERVWRNSRRLCTFCIFSTYACMQTEVGQEMEFIVNIHISNKVVTVCLVIFKLQCSQRILGRIRIGCIFPVRVAEA